MARRLLDGNSRVARTSLTRERGPVPQRLSKCYLQNTGAASFPFGPLEGHCAVWSQSSCWRTLCCDPLNCPLPWHRAKEPSQKGTLKTENTKSLTCMPFSDDIFFRGKKITKTIRIEPLTFLKSSGCGRWLPNGSHQRGHRYSRVLMFFPTWRVACGGGVPACRRIFCLIVIVMREADVPRWCRPRSQRRRRSGGRTEAGPSGITTREASIQPTRL